LFAAIRQLQQTRGGNIITVEDPIEYEIPGISQIEVDSAAKVTFARALRSILRHDPDVIMLGEIRDAETAELAIKAALTGHLVLSTLHTNTAAGAVTRLIDMGVEPFLVAATLRLAVAQRLVRRLCPECRTPVPLDATQALALGQESLTGSTVYQPRGCTACAGKGFVGRVALFEMFRGGNDVSQLITESVSEAKLLAHMQTARQPLLLEDGIRKALSGTTTVQQVLSTVATW
jgi:type II secretory ATPase GspE/PulE/Tfp pilus assembly ATPase PilB-like protein